MAPPELVSGPRHDIVSALAYSLAAAHAAPDRAELAPPYNDLTQFVLRQQARLGGPLRAPLAALTHAFDWLALQHGARFCHQPPEKRARQIAAWRHSPLGFQRDFIRFYESLVTLALHSRGVASPPPVVDVAAPGVIASPPDELLCEVAVIGSGPGGSITACLLAEAGRDVLLIEEGPFAPPGSTPAFSVHEMERKYRNGGLTVTLGRTKIAYVEGRCVGGGSEVNSGLYHRTPPDILDAWRRDFQVEALTEADLRPHFDAAERDLAVSTLPPGAAPLPSRKLEIGAQQLGWKSLEVPRWFRPDPTSPEGGHRQSMTRTYVPRFLAAGGRLLPRTRVARLRRGSTWELHAERESGAPLRIAAEHVFVAGGAVHTPALLRRSGFTSHVGDSLRLHPTVKLVARFPEAVNPTGIWAPVHQVKEFAPRLSFGGAISSPPYLALGLLDHPDAARRVPEDWPHLATYYAMISGEGSGSVRTVPGSRDPIVRYRLTARDRRDLGDGLRKLGEMLWAAGATQLYPTVPGQRSLASPADLSAWPNEFPAGANGLITIHLFSSCPMGERRDRCAVDSFGRVPGVKGLHVADASLLCGAPGVNPQGTIMALARRNALHFLGKL